MNFGITVLYTDWLHCYLVYEAGWELGSISSAIGILIGTLTVIGPLGLILQCIWNFYREKVLSVLVCFSFVSVFIFFLLFSSIPYFLFFFLGVGKKKK